MMTARPVIAATPGETPEKAARRLVQRFVGNRADQFVFEAIPQEDSRDVFELGSRDGKIVVRGSTGVAMASGGIGTPPNPIWTTISAALLGVHRRFWS